MVNSCKRRSQNKRYYANNREKILCLKKAAYATDPEKMKMASKAAYSTDLRRKKVTAKIDSIKGFLLC